MTPSPRVRFAPSPTGYLHVGGARTALFNWLYARKTGGTFVLRIEDTDRERSSEAHTRVILDGLTWLGITWDEGPFFQGAYAERHRDDAMGLLREGKAYRCFCTREELDAARAEAEARKESFRYDGRCGRLAPEEIERRVAAGMPYTIRLRMPDVELAWDDAVHGRISFQGRDLDDFVILRSDGTAIYNLAVVSDDIEMAITHVIRGDDHVSNTPKQIALYRALGKPEPVFAHVPMILGTDGKKLSKRHGATAVGDYQDQGIFPAAMRNFLALLGWSPGGDREVMTVPEMIELFSTDGLQRKAAIFDPKKLEWMNGQHLSIMPLAELEPTVTRAIVASGLATEGELAARRDWYLQLIDLLRVRARVVDDIVRQAVPYFAERIEYDPDAVAKQWKDRAAASTMLRDIHAALTGVEAWDAVTLEAALRALADRLGVGGGKLFQPLRVALTGLTVSPGIFDVLVLQGRERSLARIDAAIDWLSSGGNG
jgi:glutamyl-tRNA synthetase